MPLFEPDGFGGDEQNDQLKAPVVVEHKVPVARQQIDLRIDPKHGHVLLKGREARISSDLDAMVSHELQSLALAQPLAGILTYASWPLARHSLLAETRIALLPGGLIGGIRCLRAREELVHADKVHKS